MPGKHHGHAKHGQRVSDEIMRERFLMYVEPFDGLLGCWIWRGADKERTYGRFNLHGTVVQAHRASWILWRGELEPGILVLHHCDVPQCVNFRHLWLGYFTDNSRDMVLKERDRWHSEGRRALPWTAEDYLVWYATYKRRTLVVSESS